MLCHNLSRYWLLTSSAQGCLHMGEGEGSVICTLCSSLDYTGALSRSSKDCVCTMGVLYVYCVCTVGVLCVYCVCTVGVLWGCCVCTVGCCVCTVSAVCVYCVCLLAASLQLPSCHHVLRCARTSLQISIFTSPSD